MKIFSVIVAFSVIFLSVKPAMDTFSFSSESQQTCCSSSKCSPISENQDSQNDSDQETNGVCNPFQACCSCLLHCGSTPLLAIVQIDISTKEESAYTSFVPTPFISDFWQPPQVV